MKDLLPVIQKRRSVRNFEKALLKNKDVCRILEAGRWAPSGMNNQPWRFLVIADPKGRARLAEYTAYGSIIRKARILILVFMDIADSYNRDKDLMASGACIQNMLLEASSLKISSCWMGEILNKKEQILQLLKLDSDLELLAVIALGKNRRAKTKGCRKPLKKLILKSPEFS